jgi:hypothetical protein
MYEYDIVDICYKTNDDLIIKLNNYGKDKWRIIKYIPEGNSENKIKYVKLVLEREIIK